MRAKACCCVLDDLGQGVESVIFGVDSLVIADLSEPRLRSRRAV